jgi:hypothetical protein
MSSLLNQVSRGDTRVAYQTYTLQHGIEAIQIQVPMAKVKTFEEQFAQLKTKHKTTIISLVEQVGGKVRVAK